jgi:ketosteroid isomerase-like protein
MSRSHRQIAQDFFTALSRGDLRDELFTDDASIWTNSSGAAEKAKYQGAVKLLQSLFEGGLGYTVDSLTAEDDRVAAEVRGRGTLKNGNYYSNTYVFILRIRDERIAAVAEHCNTVVVRDMILPLMLAAMQSAAHG